MEGWEIGRAREVFRLEIGALESLSGRIGEPFREAVASLCGAMEGGRKVLVCGVGKSGDIGHKLAATFRSTGAPAVVLDVQNALHGDLGLVVEGDVALLMSYSGETSELLGLLPHLRARGAVLIALTGREASTLGRHCDVVLECWVEREACPLGLAPTASTTAMLVLGDALAMVLLEARGFREEDFASLHPGGSLGRHLLTRVRDVMRGGEGLAVVRPEDTVAGALDAMARARSGAAVVVGEEGGLMGVFTHGDLARCLRQEGDVMGRAVGELMTVGPVTVGESELAAAVVPLFEKHRVDELVVVDGEGCPVGLVDSQDLGRMKLL